MSIPGDLRALSQLAKELLAANRRKLTVDEISEATKVFGDTIDSDDVLIADKLGYGGRAFTYWAGALSLTAAAFGPSKYVLFMGSVVFKSMPSMSWATFIHEMTHVWQGQNHFIHDGYMWNSMISQAMNGNSAYNYEVGRLWSQYNSEQQAHIVEDWYAIDKMARVGDRYFYVKNFILHPRRSWLTEFAIPLDAL